MFELVESIRRRDPARPTFLEVVLAYPGFHVQGFHAIASRLWKFKLHALARLVSHLGRFFTGIEIHPGATIGRRLFIDHGMGVVIGETAVIGDDVLMYHGATLGGRGGEVPGSKRHPTLGNGVTLGTGAKILGNIRIGDNVLVPANAVVTRDIPDKDSLI